ncbi:MAG: hypothetical protein H6712_08895 [Myxococcales bacterium]|nr:hypothetical protein [Myxococcales bacterium]MCB9713957.1 hypothetical protein [Myxococcales bacterium]
MLAWGIPRAELLAAPIRGAGTAKASETKEPSLTRARARALRRARRSALEQALGQVEGPVDKAARKSVLDADEAWTGAYRILSETSDGDEVRLELEVEIDLVRLAKRVHVRAAGKGTPMFRLGDVGSAEACGEAEAVVAAVRDELAGQGAVALDGKAEALDVALDCQSLGPVQHTYLHAVRVQVMATAEGRTVAERVTAGFANGPGEAMAVGLHQALGELAEQLADRRRGHVRLRVRAPLPSVRVRRLETAMRNSVLGVDAVELSAIERGLVELRVSGELSAEALARRLEALSVPGLSLSVIDVEPPDVLTIAFE